MKKNGVSNDKSVRAIERAYEILNCFDYDNSNLTIAEISKKINLPTTTTARIVNTMNNVGLLNRSEDNKTYYLGPFLYRLGFFSKKNISIVKIAQPYMKEIRDKTKEAVTLYVLEDGFRVCYEHIDSLLMMTCVVRVGDKFPLWAGAGGKSILAYCDESFVLEQIKLAHSITSTTITNKKQFFEELNNIRNCGYSISYGEREEGIISVGVPIFNFDGNIIASLSVAGPSTRFTIEVIDRLMPELKYIASIISKNLGFKSS